MALLYKATKEVVKLNPGNGKTFTLAELQAAVGGMIEAVPGTRGRALCNEEGRMLNLPRNENASNLFGMALVGDVIVLEKGDRA